MQFYQYNLWHIYKNNNYISKIYILMNKYKIIIKLNTKKKDKSLFSYISVKNNNIIIRI